MNDWKIKGKPAFIIIHMQRSIASGEGRLAHFGHWKAGKEAGVVARQQALLKAFREKGYPVVYVNATHVPDPVFPAYGRFWQGLHDQLGVNLAGSKDVQVIPELAPLPGEPVLGNWPISIFANSGLDEVLKKAGAETVVMAGLATEIAVFTSAINAAELGYSVIVPSDASNSANARAHMVVMEDMLPAMALVTTTEDVLAKL